jgi:hypothetical protein
MLKWLVRFFLFRVLPGRVILFMSIADLFFLLRSLRRRRLARTSPAALPYQSAPPQRSPRR